ncbi:MAG: ABC transporter permease [Panacagrimonas sp.]
MFPTIIRKELRVSWRAGRVWPLLFAWIVLSALAGFGSIAAQQRTQAERSAAAELDRQAWEAQGARNPHSAAHFGQYAYKPATMLGALEPGLDAWFGTSIWMEAHYQNPASQRAAEDLTSLSRMGALSLGWMLQVLLPLTVLVLGFDLFAEERTRGALKLQLIAGARPAQLMLGKALSLLITTLVVTSPAWFAALLVASGTGVSGFADGAARLGWWLLAYGVYGLIWVLLTLTVSAFAAHARVSLGLLSGVWLLGVLLLPRLAAEQAESTYPTPQAAAFWSDIRKAQSEGMDGHNPGDARTRQLEADTLKRYGVDTIEELPVSFAGIALQASEEYGDQVFDRFFTQLWSGYTTQADFQQRFSWVAPVMAARDLAMTAAGTDVAHHQRFAQAAEQHRRALQRFLNDDMTAHAKGQDFDYLASPDFWAKAPHFDYMPPVAEMPQRALMVLATWLAAGMIGCAVAARRLRGDAA